VGYQTDMWYHKRNMSRTKLDESGSLLVPLVVIVVLLFGTIAFGVWAYLGMQDYKTNSDQKSAAAVAQAVKEEDIKKDAAYAEAEKSPFKTYKGPEAYGSLSFQYPKTWSTYVVQDDRSQTNLAGYMNFDIVPNIASKDVQFALKFTVLDQTYNDVVKSFDSLIQAKSVQASAYQAPKVAGTAGMKFTGKTDRVNANKIATLVVFPVRDKTIEIWTEGDAFLNDFNNTILPSLTFVP
jgi:hypothetical protein